MRISAPRARRLGANLRRNRAKSEPTIDHVEEPKHEEPKPEIQQPVQKKPYWQRVKDKWNAGKKQSKDAFDKNGELEKEHLRRKSEYKQQITQGVRNVVKGIGKRMTTFIAEKLNEHSEAMNTSDEGSPNLLPLVHAAMNGDPATTQSMFADTMKQKMAVAIDAYKQIAMQNVFNEPSDLDADDYEDGEEALAEDFGPEDEDEFPEDEPDDEDLEFDDEEYDGSDDDESEDEV